MFDKINLEEILRDGKNRPISQFHNLDNIYIDDEARNKSILRNIFSKGGNVAEFHVYNKHDVFSLTKIKELCINYNLRFLEASYFIGEIPKVALNKIKYLEDYTNQEFRSFKIIAPARRFQLEDENADPLLFVNLGNDKFMFIHKWGTDLKWFQKIINAPIRNYSSLTATAIIFSAVVTLLIPNNWLSTLVEINYLNLYRLFFFFWITLVTFSFTSFCWMSFRKNVSSDCWDQSVE